MSIRIDDRARGDVRAIWRLRAARACAALGLGVPLLAGANCAIQTMEMPVVMSGSRAIATVGINGTQVPLVVDTGAYSSFLTDAAADQLKLPLTNAPFGLWVEGATGAIDVRRTRVKSLQLVRGQLPNIDFLVGGNEAGEGSMGLLGRNLLAALDTEYDLAHGVIRFVLPNGECGHRNMAYWAGSTPVSGIDLESAPREKLAAFRAKALLNGKSVTVMFDSGAMSLVTLETAKRAGLTSEQMKSAGRLWGAGKGDAPVWTARFDSFEIGAERIENNQLEVADIDGRSFDTIGVDMLLGIDFFLSHRIYVSQSQQRMFFTYNGGPIFRLNHDAPEAADGAASAPEAPLDADGYARRGAASVARGAYAPALADLDRACALAPDSADYRVQRGIVHLWLKQTALARADFDESLRLDPTQAQARLRRAALREAAGDRDGVLEDLDALDKSLPPQAPARLELAHFYGRLGLTDRTFQQWALWIPAHPHDIALASVLNQRCRARLKRGADLDQALADCDQAVDLESKNAKFLDSRGWLDLRMDKPSKAVDDFDRALAIEPKAAWSLYGRGLARTRLGDHARGDQDIQAARQARPTIEADAARDGLAPASPTAP